MASLMYGYCELLICLRFAMAALEKTRGVSHFDVGSDPFKFQIGTLTWPCGTLRICYNTKKKTITNLT